MKTRAHLPALALAALLACGGSSSHPPGGGGGSSSGGGSGSSGGSSSGGVVAACPGSAPASGSSCSSRGLACEYGSDPDLACDTYSVCGPEGQWSTTPAETTPGCPTNPPGSSGCPTTYAGVAVGQSCTQNGLECGYSQGRCACTTQQSGPPTVGNPGPVWVCEEPGAGCPEPRPALGTACTTPNAQNVCDYGGCTLPGGTTIECSNGSWAQALTACAD